ncbi:hypothetical protein OIU84_008656 [Salix udensis]|uniref:Uncharacterized protein n=1 Tax=Salix udensis TaxID=889485 RepID=A0AAD6JRP4_9ROSI|nr:hypothetical protein OIU84_008656 [Salix udensis]
MVLLARCLVLVNVQCETRTWSGLKFVCCDEKRMRRGRELKIPTLLSLFLFPSLIYDVIFIGLRINGSSESIFLYFTINKINFLASRPW